MTSDTDPIAIAEVVNKHGDPEAFAERELVVLHNIQSLPIGTQLFAVYPMRRMHADMWTDIRETLQAVALEGATAELDEVDAQLLLGLVDRHPDAPPQLAPQTLQAVIESLESGIRLLSSLQNNVQTRALRLIFDVATSPNGRLMLDHIAELARDGMHQPSTIDLPELMDSVQEVERLARADAARGTSPEAQR